MIQAIILAGGKGTRISPLYPDIPKALVPVNGEPFLFWQLDWLKRSGVQAVHLALGYKAEKIRDWIFGSGGLGLDVSYTEESEPLGTGGCIRFAEKAIQTDPFLVVNGDTLLPHLDISAHLAAHKESGAPLSLAVTEVDNAGRYGSLKLDRQKRITAFIEKGSYDRGLINGGFYMLARSVLKQIPDGSFCSLEQDVFPGLAEKRKLYAHKTPPPLLDMGTPEGLEALEDFLR